MKCIVPRIGVFLLIFFIIDQIIFRIYSHETYDLPLSYGSLSRLFSGTINTDIIIFGSSRTLLHVDPAVIEENTNLSAFNLAADGSNIFQSLFTLEEYLLHNKKPKLILFEADLNQLDKNNLLRFEKHKFREYCYLSKHTSDLFNFSILQKISHSLVKSQFAANNPYVFFSFFTKTIYGKKEKAEKSSDYGDWILSNGAVLKKRTILHSATLEQFYYRIEITDEIIGQFEKIADWANVHEIPLIFFSPPINYWIKNGSLEEGIAIFKTISKRNKYITYADYSFDADFSSNVFLWWNVGHLNIEGARLLSEKISMKINEVKSARYNVADLW